MPLNKQRQCGTWEFLVLTRLFLTTLVLVFITTTVHAQTINPVRYYTFNGVSAGTDSMGIGNLNFTTYGSGYTVGTGGQVGKFLTLTDASGLIDGGPLSLTNAVTIEFLLKPGYDFNVSKIIQRGDDAFSIRMEFAKISFGTTHKSSSGANVVDELVVELDGIGRKSYGYYVDNNWHHIVFRFDATTGVKSIWVDGQNPAGFSKTIATGTFQNTGNTNFYLNHSIKYVKYYGSIDELAIYNSAIPDNLIYKHYLGVQSGQPYNFVNNYSGGIPAAAAVTGPVDPAEFAPGHPNVTVSASDQIVTFPVPRFKPGHTLIPNIPLYGIEYLGGLLQSGVSYSQALNNAKIQQADLINNFNQSILITSNTHEYPYYGDTTKFAGWFLRYANQNPTKHTSVFAYWPQLNPTIIGRNSSTAYAMCNCLSNRHYLQNSSGQFLDINGNVTSSKFLSPAAPVDSIAYDGLTQKYYLQQLESRLTRPLNLIFENGELIPFYNNSTVLSKDPSVVTDKNSTGLDWYTYEGKRAKEKVLAYRDQFMNIGGRLAGTTFAYFQVDGQPTWRFKYSEMRQTNTQINGQYYPTGDIYMRYPNNWRYWSSAWHGWQWVVESRKQELAVGDKLFSPPVAAGWDIDEEKNIRPAQWLGMLKAIAMSGAEFFYPSFFNLTAPYQNSKNWAWQVVMPAYAQAVTSRYEDLLRNGFLMEGDVPNDYVNPQWNAYSFKSGDLRKLVVIRKHNTLQKYAITGTLQPNTNQMGGAENSGTAQITLDGQTLKFQVRRQGSTYIYDKTNAATPVFYQLDGWHESTHPYNWSKEFNIEAELFDNTNSNLTIKTSVPAGTAAGDYTNYTSYLAFNVVSDAVYYFQPRMNAASTHYLWVRARSKDGSSTGFTVKMDGGTANTFDCIKDTNWVWYRFNTSNVAVSYSGLSKTTHELKISALNAKIEIDKISLVTSSGAVYGSAPNACSMAQASITPQGATSFCQGGSVTLTASAGTSYLWSNGATSQSINVTSSGTYTVTVTTAGVGSSTSSPVTVTVYTLPTATITAGGPTTFCSGGNVTLTASAGSSYLWSPGNQTSQSITVSASGTYNVRVTNSNGCTKISSNTTVTVNALPSAVITPGGSLNLIQGQTVTLTSSSGSSYLWLPGNQTSQSITVGTAGSYTVRVTNSSGCSATSTPAVVTVNTAAPATITPLGATSFCQGGSVVLSASAGTSYLWSNGATSQNISVTTSGTYTVTVTTAGIGSSTSSPVTVTVYTLPTATISAGGPTTFCSGGSVTLTASSGSSYLWSPGNQTSQSITVSSTGTYNVRVTNSNGCTKVSSNTTVTVNALPTASITPNGSLNLIQGQTVNLASSPGSSYLWSPGNQTTSSITVGTAGSYTVRVTNSSGCSATSAPAVVTVGTAVPATITPSGATSFCSGGSVTLTANTGTAYLWSTGATTKTITATTSGTYTVTVTNNGIPSVSPGTIVTVWSLPTSTITASGSTALCTGSTVTLTASSGTSYSWSPGGQTSQSITVSAAGSYSVTVYNSNGCSKTSLPVSVTSISCTGGCDMPYGLATMNVTSNSATVKWTNPNTGQTHFQVKLKNMSTNYVYVTGTVPSTTTTITVGANANTTYRWWVRSWCGSTKSAYAGYLTYSTLPVRPYNDGGSIDVSGFEPLFLDDETEEQLVYLNENEVTLYPNPTSTHSTISFHTTIQTGYTIQIMDIGGKILKTEVVDAVEGFNLYTVDVSNFQRGLYLVKLTGGNTTVTKRLAVQ